MKNPTHSIRDHWNRNITKPLFTSTIILIVAVVILVVIDLTFRPGGTSFWDNIFAELHGMLFDVAIILFLFNWIESKKEKKLLIRRYIEEIEDYLPWKNEEATWRIKGVIRRLNHLGVSKIILDSAYLHNVDLIKANLQSASLMKTDLSGADLSNANLTCAFLQEVDLIDASLRGTIFTRAYLFRAQLEEAVCYESNFEKSNMSEARLDGTSFINANLKCADLQEANFNGTILKKTNLEGANLSRARLDLFLLKEAYLSTDTIMMDGTPYDDSWKKRIEEAEVSKS